MKHTKVDEMKVQMETFYQEIIRLGQMKTVNSDGPK